VQVPPTLLALLEVFFEEMWPVLQVCVEQNRLCYSKFPRAKTDHFFQDSLGTNKTPGKLRNETTGALLSCSRPAECWESSSSARFWTACSLIETPRGAKNTFNCDGFAKTGSGQTYLGKTQQREACCVLRRVELPVKSFGADGGGALSNFASSR